MQEKSKRFDFFVFRFFNGNKCLSYSIFFLNFANVIRINKHIEALLLTNDCVIVPELGGFVAHHLDASYDEEDGMFLPPRRMLGFNAQLKMNDSLLVQSYVDAYDYSYPDALACVEAEVEAIRRVLEDEGSLLLDGLGTLYINQEGALSFSPLESGILTPSLYALSGFEMQPLLASSEVEAIEVNKVEEPASPLGVVAIEREPLTGDKRISISVRAMRNVAVAACVAAFCFFVMKPMRMAEQGADHNIKSGVLSELYSSPSASTEPTQLVETKQPATESEASKADVDKRWSIVMCTNVSLSGAESYVQYLDQIGYSEAYTTTLKGNSMVLYGAYATLAEARKALNVLKQDKLFADSWVINVK